MQNDATTISHSISQPTSLAAGNLDQLLAELKAITDEMIGYEFELVKQNALSDRYEILQAQHEAFEAFAKTFSKRVPHLMSVLNKCKDALELDQPSNNAKSQDDLKEANSKLELVSSTLPLSRC